MEIPRWSDMDQKQRIMAIGGGVVLVIALVLIVRGLMGGGGAVAVPTPEAITALEEATQDGTFKSPPPEKEPLPEMEPGAARRLQPE